MAYTKEIPIVKKIRKPVSEEDMHEALIPWTPENDKKMRLLREQTERIINLINPHYYDSLENEDVYYTNNCAICTMAGELQSRGINVEAGPYDENNWRGLPQTFITTFADYDSYVAGINKNSISVSFVNGVSLKEAESNIKHYLNNPNKFSNRKSKNASILIEYMQKWGNNSSAELNICFKNGKTCSMWVTNRNGKIIVVDFQCGRLYTGEEISSLMNHTMPSKTSLIRLDNLTRRIDNIAEQDLMFKNKKKENKGMNKKQESSNTELTNKNTTKTISTKKAKKKSSSTQCKIFEIDGKKYKEFLVK